MEVHRRFRIQYILLLWISLYTVAVGQGLLRQSLFLANPALLNPAYAGTEEYTTVHVGTKQERYEVPDAISLSYASIYTRVRIKEPLLYRKDKLYYSPYFTLAPRNIKSDSILKAENERLDSIKIDKMLLEAIHQRRCARIRQEHARKSFVGLGGNVFRHTTSLYSITNISFTIANQIYLSPSARLGLGASLSYVNYSISDVGAAIQVNDNIGFSSVRSRVMPDISAGVAYTDRSRFFGISYDYVLPLPWKTTQSLNVLLSRAQFYLVSQLSIHGAQHISLGKKKGHLTPHIQVSIFESGYKPNVLAGLKYQFNNIYAQAMYHSYLQTPSFGLGAIINQKFELHYNVGYTIKDTYYVDWSIIDNSPISKRWSHEIILAYRWQYGATIKKSRFYN